ncbi:MAG: flagellar motor protein MotB [Pseudomonadota bacterium]
MPQGQSNSPPIIIKKVKKFSGGGHHGGAWKVAYADFVTAMMAFFLLMWLLNATTEDQRKGLADYFNPSIPLSKVSGGGADALNGSSVSSDNTLVSDTKSAVQNTEGANSESANELVPGGEGDDANKIEDLALSSIEDEISEASALTLAPSLAEHIQTRMTPDGLVVELVDTDGTPLYSKGSAVPSPLLAVLLDVVAPILATVENEIAVIGHTDSLSYSSGSYTNWELSTDRAHAARRQLLKSGIETSQIVEITGKADTEPLSNDPYAPHNRRIAILLLNLN